MDIHFGRNHGKIDISLTPMDRELYHRFFREFETDPMMGQTEQYVYDQAKVDVLYKKDQASDKVVLMVIRDGEPIGSVKLKHIDTEKRSCELGIHMQNDSVKGKGYGTRAEELALKYAFGVLGMELVYAETLIGNTRSQHVLEKVGLCFTHQDSEHRYYAAR